jgi:hypothetical protein
MSATELLERDARREIGKELLQAVREMNARQRGRGYFVEGTSVTSFEPIATANRYNEKDPTH